jgi:hypothetical protein
MMCYEDSDDTILAGAHVRVTCRRVACNWFINYSCS